MWLDDSCRRSLRIVLSLVDLFLDQFNYVCLQNIPQLFLQSLTFRRSLVKTLSFLSKQSKRFDITRFWSLFICMKYCYVDDFRSSWCKSSFPKVIQCSAFIDSSRHLKGSQNPSFFFRWHFKWWLQRSVVWSSNSSWNYPAKIAELEDCDGQRALDTRRVRWQTMRNDCHWPRSNIWSHLERHLVSAFPRPLDTSTQDW